MSDRKQTPDILADLLGGSPSVTEFEVVRTAPVAPVAKPVKTTAKSRQKQADERKPAARLASAGKTETQLWEHRVASFQDHKGWRLRYVDGVEVANWANGVTLCAYIAQASIEGWQVAGACAGQAMFGLLDKYQVYLKRLALKDSH